MDIKPFENKVWLSSPTMHGDELKYITEAYETNWMSTVGENINEIERQMAEKIGCGYAVALSCGTSALHLAMKLAGIKPGDEVLCSDMTFDATVNPVVYDDDALARVAVQHGYTVLGARLDLCNEDLLGVDDAAAVFDVLDALGILAEGRVPTLEDIMKSYLESCVDVPAGGWGTFAER